MPSSERKCAGSLNRNPKQQRFFLKFAVLCALRYLNLPMSGHTRPMSVKTFSLFFFYKLNFRLYELFFSKDLSLEKLNLKWHKKI